MSIEHFPGLAGLAAELSGNAGELAGRWRLSSQVMTEWLAGHPDLRDMLREQLAALPAAATAEIAAGSRETTTHFAWRLVDEPAAPFSLWLHEYKPQRDWWQGYANSVHDHRYHFCTTLLAGGFQHEWYEVRFDRAGEQALSMRRRDCETWRPGEVHTLTADQFHRVAAAFDGTLTFLVKSRPVRPWSVSIDPATNVTRRHVPVEHRIHDLANRI